MSEENQADNDPERTLVTLEQLSQTIEVMTSVVNRLRQHLSEQLQAKLAEQKRASEAAMTEGQAAAESKQPSSKALSDAAKIIEAQQQKTESSNRESFVVEIRQQESEPVRKSDKTLH